MGTPSVQLPDMYMRWLLTAGALSRLFPISRRRPPNSDPFLLPDDRTGTYPICLQPIAASARCTALDPPRIQHQGARHLQAGKPFSRSILSGRVRQSISSRMQLCRPLADLINGNISIRYKVELARSGRIDGSPPVAVTVVDRLTALYERRDRYRAGDHPLKCFRGRPFRSRRAFSTGGFVPTVLGGIVHFWRPATTFSGIGEQTISHSICELGLKGFKAGSCVADVAQDLLVFSRLKDPDTGCVQACTMPLLRQGI